LPYGASDIQPYRSEPLDGLSAQVKFPYGALNVNTVKSFLLSSTAAKRANPTGKNTAGKGATAIPNAAPGTESIENSATKLPSFVNSTISLFWLGVADGFTASPFGGDQVPVRRERQRQWSAKVCHILADNCSPTVLLACKGCVRDRVNCVVCR